MNQVATVNTSSLTNRLTRGAEKKRQGCKVPMVGDSQISVRHGKQKKEVVANVIYHHNTQMDDQKRLLTKELGQRALLGPPLTPEISKRRTLWLRKILEGCK
ncbi:hypothetical protein Q1695_008448 [Nippostrongylus brasiliensis]|nr:hypothetical protein Q1695_008448 [Nippostrongylus brasiliensis]